MIGKPSNNINLVLYEELKTPKCIKLNKTFLRFVLISIPVILIASISLSLYLSVHMKSIIVEAVKKEPLIIKKLKKDKILLLNKQKTLEILNKDLIDKLNTPITQSENILVFFKKPLGFQDLTKKSPIELTHEKMKMSDNNKITFSFNIENNKPEYSRQSGHIFVVLKADNSVHLYPKMKKRLDDSLTTFNTGETFSVARFRPVVAEFKNVNLESEKYFKVLIFTIVGDLICNKTFGPFK